MILNFKDLEEENLVILHKLETQFCEIVSHFYEIKKAETIITITPIRILIMYDSKNILNVCKSKE